MVSGLILLDLNLPRRNGLQVLAELKADPDLLTIPVGRPTATDRPGLRRTAGLYPDHVAPDPGTCIRGVRGCHMVLEPHLSSRAAFRYGRSGHVARPGHAWR